ncbi:hypothetical protein [Mucilaginibacter xinganensis]|uniref:Uncharacterized protein n=1 Tax=Mucilaginibacter xinganensis TaxID=1234841 RepID=A0A223NSH2_9SPHI|nr:hypothetical protein [Mucilaginibacter xinganensis]ASU32461.1 hypothetical protein MuYL_0558 [Mucilaginibacter xinganensis]
MEDHANSRHKKTVQPVAKARQEVYVLRDLKEYLGESLLIIFSVLLALVLTEFINKQHEKSQTKELLNNIKEELKKNKQAEQEQYVYQQGILKRIDSVLRDPGLQKKVLTDGTFHLDYLAPEGVSLHDLSRVAWQVAQSHDITPKLEFKLVEMLTDIYDQQARIDKIEDKEAAVFLNYESRKPENIRETLILMRDNYHGWAFDRAPALIKKYDAAIKEIDRDL